MTPVSWGDASFWASRCHGRSASVSSLDSAKRSAAEARSATTGMGEGEIWAGIHEPVPLRAWPRDRRPHRRQRLVHDGAAPAANGYRATLAGCKPRRSHHVLGPLPTGEELRGEGRRVGAHRPGGPPFPAAVLGGVLRPRLRTDPPLDDTRPAERAPAVT